MRNIYKFLLPLLLISGCAFTQTEVMPSEEILRANEIWQRIEERNRTVENQTEWINDSYKWIRIRPLINIQPVKYGEYRKFLDNGRVYIIIHPAYFTFFHHPKIKRENDSLSENIMDIFLDGRYSLDQALSKEDFSFRYVKTLREFERIGRNFLEFKSTEQKLVILIIPGNYKSYQSYRYKNGRDEFAGYINDVTNMSDSVIYLESKKPNRGQLDEDDLNTLEDFLEEIGANSILLGGEYIGRCEEDLYKQFSETFGSKMTVEIAPELSPPSPDDMSSSMEDMIGADNRLNIDAVISNILNNKYDKLDSIPRLRNLKSRLYYENPNEN